MKNLNVFGIVCAVVMMVAQFLPFIVYTDAFVEYLSITHTSVTLAEWGNGDIVIGAGALAIVLFVLKKDIIALIPGAVALFFIVISWINELEIEASTAGYYADVLPDGKGSTFGIGLWLALIGGIGLILAPFIKKLINKN